MPIPLVAFSDRNFTFFIHKAGYRTRPWLPREELARASAPEHVERMFPAFIEINTTPFRQQIIRHMASLGLCVIVDVRHSLQIRQALSNISLYGDRT